MVVVRARVLAALTAAALTVTLAGCLDDTGSGDPPAPPGEPGQSGPDASEPTDEPSLADSLLWVGPAEVVMGPSRYIDSFVNAIKVGRTVRAYVGNGHTELLEGRNVAELVQTEHVVIDRGPPGSFDKCGAWLNSAIPDERDPDLVRAWYHAESDCNYAIDQTHMSIAYAESRDGGRTFTKPGYPDNQVVRSPTGGVVGHHTGRGAATVVRRGDHLYMYYINVLPDLSTVTSVARAPVASGGVPGTWRSYDGRGWTADPLEEPVAALDASVGASSASIHTPTDEVVLVRQHPRSGGIVLQTSRDGIHFERLPEPIVPFLQSQIRENWAVPDDGQIFGYVSAVALDGSREWAGEFYLFHMYVFPGDPLRGARYLVRRRVVVTDAAEGWPRSTVALSGYTDGADRFETSAPVKPDSAFGRVRGYLLGTSAPDRIGLFECTDARGDQFVAASCSAPDQEGRLVGYAFTSEQDGTALLVTCAAAGDQYAVLADDCVGDAREVEELGYVYPPGG